MISPAWREQAAFCMVKMKPRIPSQWQGLPCG